MKSLLCFLFLGLTCALAQSAKAYKTVPQSITSPSSVSITFQANAFNSGGVHDLPGSRFTAPTNGVYLFSTCLKAQDSSGGPAPAAVMVNGSVQVASFQIGTDDGSRKPTVCLAVPIDLQHGDYVEVMASTPAVELVISGGAQDVSWASLVKF